MHDEVKDQPDTVRSRQTAPAPLDSGSPSPLDGGDVQNDACHAYQSLSTQLAEALRQQGALESVLNMLLDAQTSKATHELAAIADRLRGLQDSLGQNLRVSVQRLEAIRSVVYLRGASANAIDTMGKDPLTGVSDRSSFERALELESARFSRYSTPFSLALLDIDQFTQCNQRYGRTVADNVLRGYANNLSFICRKNDVIARLDSDLFALVFANTSCAGALDAMTKAQKLLRQARLPLETQSVVMPSFSAGITGCRVGESVLALMGRAHGALQRAKNLGHDRIETDD